MNRWGDFELLEEIGRGSFGAVYRANHPTLQQQVALKLVPVPSGNPRDIEKVLEEPRRLASVRHQHVVVVHDARHVDGHVGICMELVRGESLAQIVARRGRFGAEETIACCAHLCRALSAIHRANIIHNDVKAQNVMREDGGRIVLMDFGAGRRLLDPTGTTGLYLVGTPAYMAPELFDLKSPTVLSDIYSLGVLLFYLLTAEYPVDARSMEQFAAAHARRERRYLGDVRDDIPDRLIAVIDRALEHAPAARYQSSGELLSDLYDKTLRPVERPRHKPQPSRERTKVRDPQRPSPRTVRQLRDASLTDARRWAGEWVGTAVAVLGAVVLIVWVLGFLATQAYNDMFGITGEFAEESPLRWLRIGLQTLPLPIYYMVLLVAASAGASFVWNIGTRLSPALENFSSRTSRRIGTLSTRAGLTDPATLPAGLLLLQLLLLAATYWMFWDLIIAISTPIVVERVEEHALLARNNVNVWLLFCGVASTLAFASGIAWAAVIRRRRAGDPGLPAIIGGIAVTGVFVAMFALPWRTYQHSTFPTVLFNSTLCFLIAEAEPRLLLICPTSAGARNAIVNRNDVEMPDPSQPRNIFDAFARGDLQGTR